MIIIRLMIYQITALISINKGYQRNLRWGDKTCLRYLKTQRTNFQWLRVENTHFRFSFSNVELRIAQIHIKFQKYELKPDWRWRRRLKMNVKMNNMDVTNYQTKKVTYLKVTQSFNLHILKILKTSYRSYHTLAKTHDQLNMY